MVDEENNLMQTRATATDDDPADAYAVSSESGDDAEPTARSAREGAQAEANRQLQIAQAVAQVGGWMGGWVDGSLKKRKGRVSMPCFIHLFPTHSTAAVTAATRFGSLSSTPRHHHHAISHAW